MRTRTKRLSVLLLSAGMVVSAACAAGVLFHGEGLIAHADNAKGMAVKYEADHELQGGAGFRSTYWDSGQSQMRIDFTFENAPDASVIFIEAMTNNVVKNNIGDYVLFDGKAISSMTGSFDWWSLGGSFGSYALGFCSNKSPNPLKTLKELTIKQGFTWLTVPTPGSWGNATDMSTCSPCEGATLDKDVVLWNGGSNGWLRRASVLEVTAENVTAMYGSPFDASQIEAKATLFDGTETEIDSAWLNVEFDGTSAGKKQATVTYQDLTQTIDITVLEPERVLDSLEVTGGGNLTAKQYESPDLSGVTVKAKYKEGADKTLTAGEYTVSVDTWTKGVKQGKISYTEFGITKEADITVNVGDPDLTTGMSLVCDGISSYIEGSGMLQFKATFKGVEQFKQDVNFMSADRLTGSHIADYVKIKMDDAERTISEWRENNIRINVGVYNSGNFVIEVTDKGGAALLARVQKITFLPGFQWVTTVDGGDRWPTYDKKDGEMDGVLRNVEGAVLKQEFSAWKKGDRWERSAARIEATYSGGPVAMGDRVDPAKITVTAYFSDGTQQNIPVTESMLSRTSFDQKGQQTLVVTYQDCTANITVQVTADTLKAIEIVKNPDILTYEVGEWDVVLKGIEVELVYETEAGTERKVTLANPEEVLEVVDWSPYTTEATSLTVSYQGKTASIPITMVPASRGGMRVAWERGGGFSSDKQSPNLSLTFEIQDVNASSLKAIKLHGNEDHVFDYIEINGKPASQWLGHGLDWIGFFQYELTLTFKGTALVWGTDSNAEDNHDPDSYYVEGVSEVVHTVKLLKGFTWYTSADGDDKWSNASENDVFVKVPHAILNEDILLINEDGYGWTRMLKQDGGQAAEDAITVSSMPTQTTYAVGEAFNTDGFEIHLKYEDGGEETVGVVSSDIVRFNNRQEGKQTVTVNLYRNKAYAVTIEVTVGEQPAEKKGCRGDLSVSAAVLAVAAAGAALLVCRKRKGSDE